MRDFLHELLDTLPDSVGASIAAVAREMVATGVSQPTVQINEPMEPFRAETPTAAFNGNRGLRRVFSAGRML